MVVTSTLALPWLEIVVTFSPGIPLWDLKFSEISVFSFVEVTLDEVIENIGEWVLSIGIGLFSGCRQVGSLVPLKKLQSQKNPSKTALKKWL